MRERKNIQLDEYTVIDYSLKAVGLRQLGYQQLDHLRGSVWSTLKKLSTIPAVADRPSTFATCCRCEDRRDRRPKAEDVLHFLRYARGLRFVRDPLRGSHQMLVGTRV